MYEMRVLNQFDGQMDLASRARELSMAVTAGFGTAASCHSVRSYPAAQVL